MIFDVREIKRLRESLGITQAELAKRVGVSQSLIAKIENGKIDPKLSVVKKILDELTTLMEINEYAERVMRSPVIVATLDEGVKEIVGKMEKHGISQVPVVNSSFELVGIIYDYVILRKLAVKSPNEISVKDILAPLPPLIDPKTPVREVMKLLTKYSVTLVVDKKLKPLGIITRSDLISYLINNNKGPQ
ncbi:MAG: XRE family transcriptional regulator [Candidatus Aramenus sulfurataquae]|uniref:CBS domain-containing protein n=2 Tax=Candidatus Aramenus sulfurataquae TaxID=1326980 RepID=W7KX37_9CREN|nr:MAG: XRE family transcriptional regulator [Candidatus Aramenus sulfurataquae]MCL7343384.1 CBS domain-containing protein [Candidatus Aramenus sulfurataquae]